MRAVTKQQIALAVLVCLCADACKPPFELKAGWCLYVRRSLTVNWTEAYDFCRSIRGRLVTSYELIKNIDKVVDVSGYPRIWTGVNGLRNERGTARDGWQLGKGNRILPLDGDLWKIGTPNNVGGNQHCASFTDAGSQVNDQQCSSDRGLLCESPSPATWQRLQLDAVSRWNVTDVNVSVLSDCITMATSSLHNCLHFVHSSLYGRCLLAHCLQDTGVEVDIRADEWAAYELRIED